MEAHPAAPDADTRFRLLCALRASPGLTVAQLARALAVDHSTAAYHLDRLVAAGVVVCLRHGGRRHSFPAGGLPRERALAVTQRRGAAALVLARVGAEPRSLGAIAQGLPLTKSGVHWHLRRLVALGLVAEAPARRGRQYLLTGAAPAGAAKDLSPRAPACWRAS